MEAFQKFLETKNVEDLHSAVENQHPEACNVLGYAYTCGKYGVPIDFEKALEYFHRASLLGSCKASENLGIIFHFGKFGVPENRPLAFQFFKKGGGEGNSSPICQYYQASFHLENGQVESAVELLKNAALQGYTPALYRLGILFLRTDESAARRCFEACPKEMSRKVLGHMLILGKGGPQDIWKGLELWPEGVLFAAQEFFKREDYESALELFSRGKCTEGVSKTLLKMGISQNDPLLFVPLLVELQ
jgi:TPR repeat protein